MAFFTGTNGKLQLDGQTIAAVQSWTLNVSVQTLSVKTLGDTDDIIEPSGRSITGSCRILYYQDTLGTKSTLNSASTFLNKVIKEREGGDNVYGGSLLQGNTTNEKFVDLKLIVNDGTAAGKFIELRALLTNVSLAMSVGEVVAADVQFQSNGAPPSGNLDI